MSHKLLITIPGQRVRLVKWSTFVNLVNNDKMTNGFRSVVDFLRAEHLDKNMCPKMRVKYAAKVFGRETVAFLLNRAQRAGIC